MTYGVTNTGFTKKTLADILESIELKLKSGIDPSLNLLATSLFGQISGIIASELSEIWDAGEEIYRSQYPDSASGDSLASIGAITNVLWLEATPSRLTAACTGTPTTVLLTGRQISTGTNAIFSSTEDKTIAAAAAWITATAYAVGDYVTNSGNVYLCSFAGTSGLGPTGTGKGIADGSAEWDYIGEGTGLVDVPFSAVATGPNTVAADILDTGNGAGSIITSVSGWSDAHNMTDGVLGTNIETDEAFRIRREELLQVTGSGSVEAIRARVRALADVIQAYVYENTTDAVDVDGLPAHSLEVVVLGGDAVEIAETIWLHKPAGILPHGSESEVITDSQGDFRTIGYSRPTDIPIYISVTVSADASAFPIDGEDQIKLAIKNYGDAVAIGEDIIAMQFKGLPLSISGVYDVTDYKQDVVDPPIASANIVVAKRELGTFALANISVTVNLSPVP